MFVKLLTNQSVNVPSKSRMLFLIGSGVGNFRRCWRLRQRLWSRPPFWSQRVLKDLPLAVKK